MSPILLLQEKLRQRHLRAELERSKAITTAATRREPEMPLLNAIAEAAKTSGKSGDEVLAEFVAGKVSHPTIEAALAASRKPAASTPAKTTASTPLKAAPAKPTASTPATSTDAPTDHLVRCVRRGYLSGTDLAAARDELDRRGVEIHPRGYSFSNKNTQ